MPRIFNATDRKKKTKPAVTINSLPPVARLLSLQWGVSKLSGDYGYNGMHNGRPSYKMIGERGFMLWYENTDEGLWVISEANQTGADDPELYGYCEEPSAQTPYETITDWYVCGANSEWMPDPKFTLTPKGRGFENFRKKRLPGGGRRITISVPSISTPVVHQKEIPKSKDDPPKPKEKQQDKNVEKLSNDKSKNNVSSNKSNMSFDFVDEATVLVQAPSEPKVSGKKAYMWKDKAEMETRKNMSRADRCKQREKKRLSALEKLQKPSGGSGKSRKVKKRDLPNKPSMLASLCSDTSALERSMIKAEKAVEKQDADIQEYKTASAEMDGKFEKEIKDLAGRHDEHEKKVERRIKKCKKNKDQDKLIAILSSTIKRLKDQVHEICFDDKDKVGRKYMRQAKAEELFGEKKLEYGSRKELQKFIRKKQGENFWLKGWGHLKVSGNKGVLTKRINRVMQQIEKDGTEISRRPNKKRKYIKSSGGKFGKNLSAS